MKPIILPEDYNYIGAFLTLRCNMVCDYCLNKQGDFVIPEEMSAGQWVEGLDRIPVRIDLPITFQGGEPTIHKDFYDIVNGGEIKFYDLLTNGTFNVKEFMDKIPPHRFKRQAKYASIRFSYHVNFNPLALVMKVWALQNAGYEVGIWGFDNEHIQNIGIKKMCKFLNIDFREKEFLDKTHGTYKYPDAIKGETKKVLCRTHELLIGPSGHIFRCHADLYANRGPIAHILDEEIRLGEWLPCENYGNCNPCDVKLKTNRLQEYGYCSVEIKEL